MRPLSDTAPAPPADGPPLPQQGAPSYSDLVKEAFEKAYPSDPEGAVSRLLEEVARWGGAAAFGVSPVQAAAILLRHLPGAAPGRQNLLVGALKRFASAQDIVQAALTVGDAPAAPDVLQATAGLLEHYASDAWPALEWLVSSGRPERRYFVWQIAACKGVDEARRAEALARLARSSDPDTRWAITEALESGPLSDPTLVWRALVAAPEEAIRSLAADRLELFGA